MMENYIKSIREKIGHKPLILVYAGGIVVNEKNEILLQKRSDFKAWGLPGGALEFGETAEEACIREYFEETGLKVSVVSLLGISTNQIQNYPNGDIGQSVVIGFVLKSDNINLLNSNNSETLALKFFKKENLPTIFNKQHLNFITKYFSGEYPFYN
ncbi:NUDIX domain-containing protein [Lactobacillus helveticus]|nr:NUDIX hydrolase [Lactobacillus helveticus]MBN6049299.1 NUDIX hydrolase [Lactobacillus helveticus]MCT0165603.1 NUDIX domain-containing protein [Lactobacillus helveticus]